MKVRKDDNGCYIVHGDCKVRPVATGQDSHMSAIDGYKNRDGNRIMSRGMTDFDECDIVTKYHIGSTIRIRVRNSQHSEIWFIHEKDRIRGKK